MATTTTTQTATTSGTKSLRNLAGKWHMNKDLSTSMDPQLEVQGFGFLMRKAMSIAPVKELTITQNIASNAPAGASDEIFVERRASAKMPGFTEEWRPSATEGQWSEWWETGNGLLGKIQTRSRWVKVGDVGEGDQTAFLTQGLGREEVVLQAEVQALEKGMWRAVQVWRVQDGRFVRKLVTTAEGKGKAETVLVCDFVG